MQIIGHIIQILLRLPLDGRRPKLFEDPIPMRSALWLTDQQFHQGLALQGPFDLPLLRWHWAECLGLWIPAVDSGWSKDVDTQACWAVLTVYLVSLFHLFSLAFLSLQRVSGIHFDH